MSLFKQEVIMTKDECDLVLKKYKSQSQEYETGPDKNFGYVSINVFEDEWLLRILLSFVEKETNLKVEWHKPTKDFFKEFWLQTYQEGDRFNKHMDKYHGRKYALGVLLNTEFEGGDFICYKENEIHKFDKIIGNCYIFSVELVHEVTKITSGERNVLVMFVNENQIV
jgi:hypothetical protein